MKVYFGASLRGKREFGNEYSMIAKTIEELDQELLVNTVELATPEKVSQETADESQNWYKKMISWINQANVCVYEVSYNSLGIGHEIGIALHKGKQVIALHIPEKRPYVIESIPNDRVQVIEYTVSDLKSQLKHAFEIAEKQLDYRFTMLLPGEIMAHLERVSETGKSRSEYIRQLIYDDMGKEGK